MDSMFKKYWFLLQILSQQKYFTFVFPPEIFTFHQRRTSGALVHFFTL